MKCSCPVAHYEYHNLKWNIHNTFTRAAEWEVKRFIFHNSASWLPSHCTLTFCFVHRPADLSSNYAHWVRWSFLSCSRNCQPLSELNVHHRTRNSPLLDPNLRQPNPVHAFTSCSLEVHSSRFGAGRGGGGECNYFPELETQIFT
jgi:hypothetical protein